MAVFPKVLVLLGLRSAFKEVFGGNWVYGTTLRLPDFVAPNRLENILSGFRHKALNPYVLVQADSRSLTNSKRQSPFW